MNDLIKENLSPKDLAMINAGATREASYKAIVSGLTCQKMTVDKFGEEHWEPDTTNQLRSAEIISRMNGDLKPDTLVDNRSVTVNTNGVSSAELREFMDMIGSVKQQLLGLKDSGSQTGEIIDITPN